MRTKLILQQNGDYYISNSVAMSKDKVTFIFNANANDVVSVQVSNDNENWIDDTESELTCDAGVNGILYGGQRELFVRLKSSVMLDNDINTVLF